MSRKLEIELEKRIAAKAVECLLSAGWLVTVHDDDACNGEDVLVNSTDPKAIAAAMFSTDGDLLLVSRPEIGDNRTGWVRFIWGNVADCLSDYTLNLEETLKPANTLAAEYQD